MNAALAILLLLCAPTAQERDAQGLIEFGGAAPAAPSAPQITEWLRIPGLDPGGRIPFSGDAVFAAHLLDPAWPPPQAGGKLQGSSGEGTWEAVTPDAQGSVSVRGGGWAYAAVRAAEDAVWIAQLSGAARLFVNGDGFTGDLYRYGYAGVPVQLRAGVNHVFVGGARGGFSLTFSAPVAALHRIPQDDMILPWVAGQERGEGRVVLTVANASGTALPTLAMATVREGAPDDQRHLMGLPLLPLAVGKLSFPLPAPGAALAPGATDPLLLRVTSDGGLPLLNHRVELGMISAGGHGLRSFVSAIDGSVQKWSAVPHTGAGMPGLVLSLHGAGVDCAGQAAAYAQKEDFFLACPTNRRPYGFDWQDWGRLDAYETLAAALRESGAPEDRVYLTGHSMGGHGSWHLAVNDPDRWAAVAPSAGWASFDSYGGRPQGARDALWRGADGSSETLALLPNLRGMPIYALHGAADDNVPLSEMEKLLAALKELGIEAQSHVEPGAGHWWGNGCVDWAPIFELFRASRRPSEEEVRTIDFRTADPGVDARHHWVEVEQLVEYGKPAHVTARWEGDFLVFGDLENVRRYRTHFPDGTIRSFLRDGPNAWQILEDPIPPREKSPALAGPFKRAFDNGFLLVYGTAGTAAENAELLARARHDAQVWWYRANACPWILSDNEYLNRRHFPRTGGHNVILYGNADSNAAWSWLVPADCPLQARRGRMQLGEQVWEQNDLAALCLTPGAEGSGAPLVGLIADTGVRGSRLGYALRLFVSGVGYPDYVVWGPRVLRDGDASILAAGFFDYRWQLP